MTYVLLQPTFVVRDHDIMSSLKHCTVPDTQVVRYEQNSCEQGLFSFKVDPLLYAVQMAAGFSLSQGEGLEEKGVMWR